MRFEHFDPQFAEIDDRRLGGDDVGAVSEARVERGRFEVHALEALDAVHDEGHGHHVHAERIGLGAHDAAVGVRHDRDAAHSSPPFSFDQPVSQ